MNTIAYGPAIETVQAETPEAKGKFQRSGPGLATLDLQYEVEGLGVRLPDGDIQAGVEALAQAEIASMRRSLGLLGEQLASQLRDQGTNPVVTRTWRDRDSRSWEVTGEALHVDPSRTRMR